MTSTESTSIEHVECNDHAKLVVETDDVTITTEGDSEEVHRQFDRHYAEAVNTTPEELAAVVEEYPMPDPDELESIPAEEFYGRDGT